jgi:hypothetical protein
LAASRSSIGLALLNQQARLAGHLSRLGEAYGMERPQPHLTLPAILTAGLADLRSGIAEDPGFGDLLVLAQPHLQPQAATVTEENSSVIGSRFGVFDLVAGKAVHRSHRACRCLEPRLPTQCNDTLCYLERTNIKPTPIRCLFCNDRQCLVMFS